MLAVPVAALVYIWEGGGGRGGRRHGSAGTHGLTTHSLTWVRGAESGQVSQDSHIDPHSPGTGDRKAEVAGDEGEA